MRQKEPDKRNRHRLIEAMINAYLRRPYSDAELGDLLETDRSNICKIRTEVLEDLGVVPQPAEERGKYYLNRNNCPVNLRFTPDEALAIYLAGRRLQQQTKSAQKTVSSALEKLSDALRKPLAQALVKSAEQLLLQEQDSRQTAILAVLRECWIDQSKVEIKHQVLHGESRTYLVHPYQIEPSIWGDALYLIGYSDYHNKIASFKLARISEARRREKFEFPETFDLHQLLQHAWGIWSADGLPHQVKLRFNRSITPRVMESVWHPSQQIKMLENGGCEWSAEIAEPREMEAWIRGWGSDVEVLEPAELREKMKNHLERLNELYQMKKSAERQPYQWLYAKTDRKDQQNIHLLLYHLIDVGKVTLVLWEQVFTDGLRQQIAAQLGVNVEEAGRFVAFITSLHDLGKASPSYQKKYSPDWLKEKLIAAGFVLDDTKHYSPQINDPRTSHAHITKWTLPTLLQQYCQVALPFAKSIGRALGGHHGIWPQGETDLGRDCACPAWDVARRELIWELRNVFQPPVINPTSDKTECNLFMTLLSGLTSVADWIGSRDDQDAFPLVKEVMTTRQYAERSQEQAKKVVADLGWLGWQPQQKAIDFATMFGYLSESGRFTPRPVQSEIIALTEQLTTPSLILIEAPTGIGKTEIAFYLADTLLQKQQGRGIYIAMPTQATSNQMFQRTAEFLAQRYPQERVNLQLAHGQARFDQRFQEISLQTVGDDREEGRIVAMSWFNEKSKRTLLAPFGVGTVDQTLMGILQTNHFFVRLLGMSHKVIIFDEVHAYDTYMNTLFTQLLSWLRAIGTSVIILSATLPAETRQKLVDAYAGKKKTSRKSGGEKVAATPPLETHYPSLTMVSSGIAAVTHPLPAPTSLSLGINWLSAEHLLPTLQKAVAQGGCIAVICNTVGRAQAIFAELLALYEADELDVERENLLLFHARFPYVWRKEIEEKTLKLFGKPEKAKDGKIEDHRPQCAIIVATQVIEQSLDLDFDVMITDVAPIDLLIQRAGRLHRHALREATRYGHPRQLSVINPTLDEEGIPSFGADQFIYERYILLRSYRALHGRTAITLPDQTTELIEAVYNQHSADGDPTWHTHLQQALKTLKNHRLESHNKASELLVARPDDELLLSKTIRGLEEDNPTVHRSFQAKTRDIGPTLSLICLYATSRENFVLLEPNNPMAQLDLSAPLSPYFGLPTQLLQRAITVQNHLLIEHFLAQPVPASWKKDAMLRHTRLVIFTEGRYSWTTEKQTHTLSLDREYGLRLVSTII